MTKQLAQGVKFRRLQVTAQHHHRHPHHLLDLLLKWHLLERFFQALLFGLLTFQSFKLALLALLTGLLVGGRHQKRLGVNVVFFWSLEQIDKERRLAAGLVSARHQRGEPVERVLSLILSELLHQLLRPDSRQTDQCQAAHQLRIGRIGHLAKDVLNHFLVAATMKVHGGQKTALDQLVVGRLQRTFHQRGPVRDDLAGLRPLHQPDIERHDPRRRLLGVVAAGIEQPVERPRRGPPEALHEGQVERFDVSGPHRTHQFGGQMNLQNTGRVELFLPTGAGVLQPVDVAEAGRRPAPLRMVAPALADEIVGGEQPLETDSQRVVIAPGGVQTRRLQDQVGRGRDCALVGQTLLDKQVDERGTDVIVGPVRNAVLGQCLTHDAVPPAFIDVFYRPLTKVGGNTLLHADQAQLTDIDLVETLHLAQPHLSKTCLLMHFGFLCFFVLNLS